jgi:hypothetical protein
LAGPIISRSNLELFRTRAAEAHAEADAATLDHVRERCLRSAAAWTALAERAERSERLRVAEARRKAEQPAQPTAPAQPAH